MRNLIGICVLASLPALAQEKNDVQKHWKISEQFTLAVANAMPEADYAFQGAPPELSFGEMVVHIAQGNGLYCSRASGQKSPITKPAAINKDSATKALQQSFEFCESVISSVTDFNKMMGPAGKQVSVRELLWSGFTHTAHHRAQLDVFLRLKGIKPPDYQF